LFKQNATLLEPFYFRIVAHCNSKHVPIRCSASALLYLLMRKFFQCDPDRLQRITVQITIAVSKIILTVSTFTIYDRFSIVIVQKLIIIFQTDLYMKNALESITKYASLDTSLGDVFKQKVVTLCEHLYTVLRDKMNIEKYRGNVEMQADLYRRLANGYMDAPNLRITSLENLASLHATYERWAESAMCNVHIAAIIAEYLHHVAPEPGLPAGCAAFTLTTPNTKEESAIREAIRVCFIFAHSKQFKNNFILIFILFYFLV
jgi:hypothetical protein